MKTKPGKGGWMIEKSITRQKAMNMEDKDQVKAIFIEDEEGAKRGGFKSVEAAAALSSKVFVSTIKGVFQVVD